MHRAAKIKVTSARLPLRKSAKAAARRAFPAWIDASERGVAFPASKTVMPRVRDGLVLRVVRKQKRPAARSSSHGGAR